MRSRNRRNPWSTSSATGNWKRSSDMLRCFTGYDESESVPEADAGEGLPPANIFGKFFS